MLERVALVEGEQSPWNMETRSLGDGSGSVVRIVGEHATDLIHARQARILASKAFKHLGVNELMAYQAETIISEFNANAVKHGGELAELDVIWTPATDEREETLDISVVNPSSDTEGTPGTANRGGLAAEESNDKAEHGRGLQIVDDFTEHRWGQSNEVDRKGRNVMVTYAILYGAKQPDFDLDSFDEVA